jgi:hypothetical protein
MDAPLPPVLDNDRNRAILSRLEGLSAHSDIAQPLCMAAHEFPGAATYCPDFDAYRYVVAYANERIFAFAEGMHGLTLRMPPESVTAATGRGASPSTVVDEWYFFPLFGAAGFGAGISAWIVLAYSHALRG